MSSVPAPFSDHRDLIVAHDLGHIEEHSPGLIHWHPHGVRVLRKLEALLRNLHEEQGYQEVRTPQMLSQALWVRSGHWDKYRANMFVVQQGDEEAAYAVKPMSCPGQIGVYDHRRRSHRELPLRLFEFGHVHRNEPSGALSGWLRLRGFVQDDSHVFAAEAQLEAVIARFGAMVQQVYALFGFESWSWRLSLRPESRAGTDDQWDRAEAALRQACAALNLEVVEAPGEGAFYGPKLEAVLRDRLGRSWQCGVAQVDFVLPERFGLSFQNAEGNPEQPVLVHHAVVGSLERWLAIVMEHLSGLPDWLVPVAVGVCPVGPAQVPAAVAAVAQMKAAGVPAEVCGEGPLAGRLRALAARRVPVWAVIGPREAGSGQLSVRRPDGAARVVEGADWAEEAGVALREHRPLPA